jgi:ribonuclease T2
VGTSSLPVHSQAWQCAPPDALSRPKLEIGAPGDIRRTPVAGYSLALSWSREYCRSHQREPAAAWQCDGKIGEFGFIVHGLWPEGRGPDYPRWCRKVDLLPTKLIAQNMCTTPSPQLQQHAWAKHGTCMTQKAETYFGAARLLFNAIEFPDMDRLSRQEDKGTPLTVKDLIKAIAAINPGLPVAAIRVQTNRQGWLQEVRLCLDKKFKPTGCPAYSPSASGNARVKIWRGG